MLFGWNESMSQLNVTAQWILHNMLCCEFETW